MASTNRSTMSEARFVKVLAAEALESGRGGWSLGTGFVLSLDFLVLRWMFSSS